jgi:beta-N-acetylhexosaminidase
VKRAARLIRGRSRVDLLLLAIGLSSLGLLLPALGVRDPFFTRLRPLPLYAITLYSIATVTTLAILIVRERQRAAHPTGTASGSRTAAMVGLLIVCVMIGVFAVSGEQRHARMKEEVHAFSVSAALTKLGAHFVVGYRDPEFVYELIEQDAIGGVFVTHHNARGRSLNEIRAEIDGFQAARAKRGAPPLWIATDQEGGGVSRLSPPLRPRPYLSELLPVDSRAGGTAAFVVDSRLAATLRAHGESKARELAALGVNVNFSPVVDLRFTADEKSNPLLGWMDAFSRIETRAVHRDPKVVEFAAGEYARGLMRRGVYPTLKHFPGLGRVTADTHWFSAAVPATLQELERADWIPFRRLGAVQRPATSDVDMIPWMMLGHAHVPAVDSRFAASHSKKIVTGLLREGWGYRGVLITDDLNMRPIMLSPGGMGGAALRSLNAGVDLLLISYDGENVYPILASLLRAERAGTVDEAALQRSKERLGRARAARLRVGESGSSRTRRSVREASARATAQGRSRLDAEILAERARWFQ